jgi:hypothetical protein
MKHTDATVTPQDLQTAMMHLRSEGMGKAAAALLQREPFLGDLIVGRWSKIQAILRDMGLSDEESRPVMVEVSRLIMEPLVAVERSHRRMWEDFLPDTSEGEKKKD